jgi:hypothetical protein
VLSGAPEASPSLTLTWHLGRYSERLVQTPESKKRDSLSASDSLKVTIGSNHEAEHWSHNYNRNLNNNNNKRCLESHLNLLPVSSKITFTCSKWLRPRYKLA